MAWKIVPVDKIFFFEVNSSVRILENEMYLIFNEIKTFQTKYTRGLSLLYGLLARLRWNWQAATPTTKISILYPSSCREIKHFVWFLVIGRRLPLAYFFSHHSHTYTVLSLFWSTRLRAPPQQYLKIYIPETVFLANYFHNIGAVCNGCSVAHTSRSPLPLMRIFLRWLDGKIWNIKIILHHCAKGESGC